MGNVTISLEDNHSVAIKKYRQTFDHGPSIEAYKFMSAEDLDKKALNAVVIGKPVEDWKNRHRTPTGTILDQAYGVSIPKSSFEK
ncbi:hypothetical protein N9H91_01775 [Pseudomonadales bacterium]|nr:hypothetical protein [Pseudomonadales bacterium]